MDTKRRLIIGASLLALLLIAGITLTVVLIGNAEPSEQDFEKWTYNYTNKFFHLRSGAAQIVLSRSITMTEMHAFGLEGGNIGKPDLPVKLVILKGDFDDSTLPGFGVSPMQKSLFKYLSLVFDSSSRAETPFLIMGSPDGSLYKKILNDPTLPDPPTPGAID